MDTVKSSLVTELVKGIILILPLLFTVVFTHLKIVQAKQQKTLDALDKSYKERQQKEYEAALERREIRDNVRLIVNGKGVQHEREQQLSEELPPEPPPSPS